MTSLCGGGGGGSAKVTESDVIFLTTKIPQTASVTGGGANVD